MKIVICLLISLQLIGRSVAQNISVNNDGSAPHTSAILDIKSTTKGLLIPRMTSAQLNAISTPAPGLLVYQTDNATGVQMFNGSSWTNLPGGNSIWNLSGNSGTNPATNFLGTGDNQPLRFRLNNTWFGEWNRTTGNVFVGDSTGRALTTGTMNVAYGHKSMKSNTTGYDNSAFGANALQNNTSGLYNVAAGKNAMRQSITGYYNTAVGKSAMESGTNNDYSTAIGASAMAYGSATYSVAVGAQSLHFNGGAYNTAIGWSSMAQNGSGHHNVAAGDEAMIFNNSGFLNVAVGSQALHTNSAGAYNSAIGANALRSNVDASENTAVGSSALYTNTAYYNTAVGANALFNNTVGNYNTAIGQKASMENTAGYNNTSVGAWASRYGSYGSNNTSIGADALRNNIGGNGNSCMGSAAGTYYDLSINNSISIGNDGYLGPDHNQVFIGDLSATWIGGNVGWYTYSDARVKKNISEDVKGIDFIMHLRPVTYNRDIDLQTQLTGNPESMDFPQKYDVEKIRFSGFLAQEVEEAAIASGYDFSGIALPQNEHQLYTLSYESFVVPLVKAVQEQQLLIDALMAEIKTIKEERLATRSKK